MSTGKKTGRPAGSKTRDRVVVDVRVSQCPKCHSTERTPYPDTPTRLDGEGTTPEGRPYTAVILRRTTCTNCGQHRVDRSYVCELKAEDQVSAVDD